MSTKYYFYLDTIRWILTPPEGKEVTDEEALMRAAIQIIKLVVNEPEKIRMEKYDSKKRKKN